MTKYVGGRAATDDFRLLAGKTSQLDRKIKAALRKRIRNAALPAARDSQQAVRSAPTSGKQSTGLREDIAQGIQVSLLTGNRAGVVIRSGANNQSHPKSVVKAFDKRNGWRHPVFGDTETWVRQPGHPYFASVISRHRDAITREVKAAMKEAGDTLK